MGVSTIFTLMIKMIKIMADQLLHSCSKFLSKNIASMVSITFMVVITITLQTLIVKSSDTSMEANISCVGSSVSRFLELSNSVIGLWEVRHRLHKKLARESTHTYGVSPIAEVRYDESDLINSLSEESSAEKRYKYFPSTCPMWILCIQVIAHILSIILWLTVQLCLRTLVQTYHWRGLNGAKLVSVLPTNVTQNLTSSWDFFFK